MGFSYFNPNPEGKQVGDCTVRAIAKATGKSWDETYVSAQVCVLKGCCVTVGMRNTSTQAVNFANSNLTVERVA